MAFIGLYKPTEQNVAVTLNAGDNAPPSNEFTSDKSYQVIAFLRHVGCPFAENTIKQLRNWTIKHDHVAVFIVSHGDTDITKSWIQSIGGLGYLHLIYDADRRLYGRWGIGYSSLNHFAGLGSLAGVLSLLPKGIHNRDASGTRWQKAALFAVNKTEILWAHKPYSAEEFLLPPDSIFS